MEWTWSITYTPAAFETVNAADIRIDEISYELVDAEANVVWSAPTGCVRNVTRGAAVAAPIADGAPSA